MLSRLKIFVKKHYRNRANVMVLYNRTLHANILDVCTHILYSCLLINQAPVYNTVFISNQKQ